MPQELFENYEDSISPSKMPQAILDKNLVYRWDVITRFVKVPSNSLAISPNQPVSLHCSYDQAGKYYHWQFVGVISNGTNSSSFYFHPRYSSSNNTHINKGPSNIGTFTPGYNLKRAQSVTNEIQRLGSSNNTYLPDAGPAHFKMAGLMQHTNRANKGFVTYWMAYEAAGVPFAERGCIGFNNTNMLTNNNAVRFTGVNFYTLNSTNAVFRGYLMGLRRANS